jgi:DNA (cytosine-5)-methyltransferase 1
MRYGSVCSGIEAASVAWHPLGWRASFLSEIEPFPRAVLSHHYPEVPLHGDFTTIRAGEYGAIDLLVGGTPCQSFSVAGLRGGLDDERGNLALEYLRLADRLRPRWLVWENVPGVLSSNGGRDFGSILGGLVELGYGFAYRVLDAQFFGVAQRRRRVFVVGYLGDWRCAAAVLFERHGLQGHPAPRREAGQGTAISPSLRARANSSHRADSQAFIPDVGYALNAHGGAHGRQDAESETLIAHALRGEGFDASEDGTGRGTPIVPVHAFDARQSDVIQYGDYTGPLDTDGHTMAICFSSKDHGADAEVDLSPTLRAGGHDGSHANAGVPPAIAFALRGREGGAMPEVGGDQVGALRAASGGSSRDYVAQSVKPMYGVTHDDAAQTGPCKALRALLEAVGEEAFAQWGLGVLAAFWPAEVLRSEVHGGGVRCAAFPQRGLVNVALSRSQVGAAWSVRDLWEAGCNGCPPSRWGPHEQLARQLGAYLSELPYSPSPAQRLLHDLWGASEGVGLLRQALSAVQEARRSARGEGQPAPTGSAVRRLTVEECEALQGFPRSYTLIPWRKGVAPDGPRYKALGNSMAVPVMAWIGRRIEAVEALIAEKAAA